MKGEKEPHLNDPTQGGVGVTRADCCRLGNILHRNEVDARSIIFFMTKTITANYSLPFRNWADTRSCFDVVVMFTWSPINSISGYFFRHSPSTWSRGNYKSVPICLPWDRLMQHKPCGSSRDASAHSAYKQDEKQSCEEERNRPEPLLHILHVLLHRVECCLCANLVFMISRLVLVINWGFLLTLSVLRMWIPTIGLSIPKPVTVDWSISVRREWNDKVGSLMMGGERDSPN